MPICHSNLLAVAIGSMTAFGLTSVAGAQSYNFSNTFGGSPHNYGLLNGDHLALYVNDRGDLGAPVRYGSATQKPQGIGNGLHPIVNTNGSVPDGTGPPVNNGPPADSGTYAALYSPTSTAGAIQASVQAKSEYVTIGSSVLEGYGVSVPSQVQGQNTWLHNGSFTAGTGASAFSVSGNIGGTLTATSQASNAASGITVGQTITIDDKAGGKQNIAVFAVTVTNTSGAPLSGVQYARVVNPNMGVNASTATIQQLGTPSAPSAFAINATTASGKQLALGIDPINSPNSYNGTTLFSTTTTTENGLFNNLNNLATSSNRVVLGTGTTASYFVGSATTPTSTTLDYRTSAFANGVNFDSSSDDALVLLSPTYDLSIGQSFSFSFSYYFDPLANSTPGNPVPEPGVWAMLAACGISGAMSARKRAMRRQR